jgi:hypothetical protein
VNAKLYGHLAHIEFEQMFAPNPPPSHYVTGVAIVSDDGHPKVSVALNDGRLDFPPSQALEFGKDLIAYADQIEKGSRFRAA